MWLRFFVTFCCLCGILQTKPSEDFLKIPPLSDAAQRNFVLTTQDFDVKYRVFTATTKSNQESQKPNIQKILVLLDGNAHFPLALNLLAQFPISSLMLVGVGYVGNVAYDLENRTLDYTPKLTNESLKNPQRFQKGGGAEEFSVFLQQRILTPLKKQYPTAEISLFGHSFGGLFCLWSYLNSADSFDSYFCASPSLWWGEGEILKDIKNIHTNNSITLSIGELENPQKMAYSPMEVRDLAKQLKDKGQEVEFIIFKNKGHGDGILEAILEFLKSNGAQL